MHQYIKTFLNDQTAFAATSSTSFLIKRQNGPLSAGVIAPRAGARG